MARKTIGELNGKWALLFKVTQVLWAILLPVLLAVLLQWLPWVTKQTILNEQFRAAEANRNATWKAETRLLISEEVRPLRDDVSRLGQEVRTHQHPLRPGG